MTDRELLKLAATAAKMQWIDDCKTGLTIQRAEGSGAYNFHWDPFADDGDALRLAIVLDIDLTFDAYGCVMAGQNAMSNGKWDALEDDLTDKALSTRRAIVRAAAAILHHRQPATTTSSFVA